jgi:hypothetical protein
MATAKRFNYTPRPYPVDERGFSPVDKALAKAYAREDMVTDDTEASLNPYVLKVISAYPLDGSYPYHCGWTPREYDSYSTTPAGGHSVIFIDWIRDPQNKIVGLKYFSSNLSDTHGVGYGSGRFSDSNANGRGILRTALHIARVGAIKDHMLFDRAVIPQRNAYAPTQPERIIYLPAPALRSEAAPGK